MAITYLVVNNLISDRYYVTVTEPGCIPVHENVVSKKYGLIHTRFVHTLFTSLFANVPQKYNPVNKIIYEADGLIHM